MPPPTPLRPLLTSLASRYSDLFLSLKPQYIQTNMFLKALFWPLGELFLLSFFFLSLLSLVSPSSVLF